MSSDRLDRKRRSAIDISDDSADELPPVKIRKSESSSNFGKVLTDKFKDLINWITPQSVKKYMIDFVKKSFNHTSETPLTMGLKDEIKNNGIDEDDDEIAIISVQNGTSSVHSRFKIDKEHNFHGGARPRNASTCPLASTPLNFPMLSHTLQDKTSRTMALRQKNGYLVNREMNNEDKTRLKKTGKAPITNPSSDIEIFLDEKDSSYKMSSLHTAKSLSSPIRKTRSSNDYYNCSKTEKANYAEALINGSSHSNKRYTAFEIERLKERAQYKLLLDKVVKKSIYRPATLRRGSQTSAIQVDLTEDDDKPSLNYHFKIEKVEQVNEFLNKYYKPCSLVPYAAAQNFKLTTSQEKLSEPEIDDDVQVIESSCLPKLKPRKKSSNDCTFFNEAWISNLKISLDTETKKRMQMISEQKYKIDRYKRRRDARAAEELQNREKYRLAGIIFPEDVEMEEDVLPEITPEMESIISRAFGPGDPSEELSSLDRLTLARNDITTLSHLNWLNDQVINFYMALIAERSKLDNFPSVHAFNSFFYTSLKTRGENNVLRWTRRIDIFSFDIILVPLHLEMHWALLIIDNRSKKIKYYDSMGSGEDKCLRIIQSYLIVEMKDKKKVIMEPNAYSLEIPKDIPQQMNGSDCGMFTLKYAEYISRDAPITFTQENMPYFRRRMVYELLTKQIL